MNTGTGVWNDLEIVRTHDPGRRRSARPAPALAPPSPPSPASVATSRLAHASMECSSVGQAPSSHTSPPWPIRASAQAPSGMRWSEAAPRSHRTQPTSSSAVLDDHLLPTRLAADLRDERGPPPPPSSARTSAWHCVVALGVGSGVGGAVGGGRRGEWGGRAGAAGAVGVVGAGAGWGWQGGVGVAGAGVGVASSSESWSSCPRRRFPYSTDDQVSAHLSKY